MIFFLYTFVICLPILLSCLYGDSIYLMVNRVISAFIVAVFIYLSTQLIKNKKYRLFCSITLSLLIYLVFLADFYSFYLQGETFNDRFFQHLRWDVITTGAFNYPLLIIGCVALLIINLMTSAYISNRRLENILSKKSYYTALLVFSFSFVTLSNPISDFTSAFVQYYNDDSSETIIMHDNSQQKVVAKPGKDLVFIYLESLEKNYLDETIFPGLTPNLNQLSKEGVFLDNFIQKQGSGFTMGGIFSSQCGIPLLNYGKSMNGNDILYTKNYNILCLGDILKAGDYNNVYYGGADLKFAGKGNFFKTHGYDQVFGKQELKGRPNFNSKTSKWGIHDQDLFNFGLEEYRKLSQSKKPFNLTLLTLDTHHPKGHTDKRCPIYFESSNNSMLNAVHCTDYLLGNFINQLKAEANWENTVVMIMSDHLAMRNIVEDKLEQKPRLLTGLILNSDLPKGFYSEPMYHVDVVSTLLSLMDVSHDHQFLMSHNILDRLGQNSHPATAFDSPEQMTELKNFVKTISTNLNICSDQEVDFDFALQEKTPILKFGNHQLIMTREGTPKLDKKKIYLINADSEGNVSNVKYVSNRELSQQIFSEDNGISFFVTQTKNLRGTDFEYLYDDQKLGWVSFIGKATWKQEDKLTYKGYTNFAYSFPRLKLEKKICSNFDKSWLEKKSQKSSYVNADIKRIK